MKALSLWQPWGSLWGCGRKANETRHWPTHYRGPLLIHAAQKLCTDIEEALAEICVDEFGGHWARDLPRGAIIGYCELVDCVPTDRIKVTDDEFVQGNYEHGRFAWQVQNARLFDKPMKYRGMQGLFDVPSEVVAQLGIDTSARWTPPQASLI